jgi:FAD/FMN-containing dehydrogenase
MIPAPASITELAQFLAGVNSRKEKAGRINLAALNRVREHTPEDMTVTVEAGITLAELQKQVGRNRQWLAIDPPHAENVTIGEIINTNASGPRRYGYGTIRDYLIGLTAVLADGTVIHSGGKVVKNVAGYDLMKLFIGGQGTVGVVVEASFKLHPLPEVEKFVSAECKSLAEVDKLIESVIQLEVTPVVLDLYRPSTSKATSMVTPVLGFAGTREEVEWQLARAAEFGFTQNASLDYERDFWADSAPAEKLSLLPSRIIDGVRAFDTVSQLKGVPFIARAGNGIIYYRGEPAVTSQQLNRPLALLGRLKNAYDPNHIFPDLPL